MKEIKIIEQEIENLKIQKDVLLKENMKLKIQLSEYDKSVQKEKEYFTKYRTLYMKYKEIIRLLQAEIVKNCDNAELFEKVEKLNIGV